MKGSWGRQGALLGGIVLGGGACGDEPTEMAWDPAFTTSVGPSGPSDGDPSDGDSTGGGTSDTGGMACEPAEVVPCLCPDGLSLGEQRCDDDGQGYSACECEDSATGDEGSGGEPMPPLPAEVCYLGADRMGAACLPLGAFYSDLPLGYAYPRRWRTTGRTDPRSGWSTSRR